MIYKVHLYRVHYQAIFHEASAVSFIVTVRFVTEIEDVQVSSSYSIYAQLL